MANKYKRIFKLFLAWQEDKECQWLREMSNMGWHLNSYFFSYLFKKGEPEDYIYNIDWKQTTNFDLDNYLEIFEDAGWEHVAKFCGYHYFRTKAENNKVPSIYSDITSKMGKYKSLRNTFAILFVINLFNLINMSLLNSSFRNFKSTYLIGIIVIPVIILLGYGIYVMQRRINDSGL